MRFAIQALLREALTHASGANHRLSSNERLEFLGDAILGAVVCDLLFRKYPGLPGRGADADQVHRGLTPDLRQDLRGSGHRRFLFMGKGMGSRERERRPRFWPTSSRA